MKDKWIARIKRLDVYLMHLENCKPISRSELSKVPAKGIYLFLEEGKPAYIGRTNRMKGRLSEHGRPGSKNNDASFAFRLAKEEAEKNNGITTLSRTALCASTGFKLFFDKAKERVRLMMIKYVEVDDPVDQALFEVYASEMFATPYNDFDNH